MITIVSLDDLGRIRSAGVRGRRDNRGGGRTVAFVGKVWRDPQVAVGAELRRCDVVSECPVIVWDYHGRRVLRGPQPAAQGHAVQASPVTSFSVKVA